MTRVPVVQSMVFAACTGPLAAWAQAYPAKPIRIIAPFSAGSITDTTARVVAQKLADRFGQQVVVDNRPGAGGALGTEMAARAVPDGYTLAMAPSSAFGSAPWLYTKPPYDPVRDFDVIANLVTSPQVISASPVAEFRTLRDFVAAAKAKPRLINFASMGAGSTNHLSMELFRAAVGIEMNHIPFKSGADMYVQMATGQVSVMSDSLPGSLPHLKAGRLRGLGVSSVKRSPYVPDLPTVTEQGLPGTAGFEAQGWVGIAAPAKTPPAILDQLNSELVRIVNLSEVRERLNAMAFTVVGNGRAEFAAYVKAEFARWGKAVRDSGAKID